MAVYEHRARSRGYEAEEHPQCRRLARSVRAEEAGDTARDGVEIEMVDSENSCTESLGQCPRLDGRHKELGSSFRPTATGPKSPYFSAGIVPGRHVALFVIQ